MRPVATTPPATTTTTVPFSQPVDTPLEAVSVLGEATTPEAISEAVAVIAENLDSLTATELEAIAQVVSAAPTEVKREFEEQVNIFGGGLDSYVPIDSNVTVGQRRALVAIGAVLTAAPVVISRKR
jgi:hypothetical protein